MFSKNYIFCACVFLAALVVILLATLSPLPHTKPPPNPPWLALSLYIQQPQTTAPPAAAPPAATFVFHRAVTLAPENTSPVVGNARGFIIPAEDFARSGFNIIYLTFDTHGYSGSVGGNGVLAVVGGTGSFAFVRGVAVLARAGGRDGDLVAPYHIRLHLKYPDRLDTIPR